MIVIASYPKCAEKKHRKFQLSLRNVLPTLILLAVFVAPVSAREAYLRRDDALQQRQDGPRGIRSGNKDITSQTRRRRLMNVDTGIDKVKKTATPTLAQTRDPTAFPTQSPTRSPTKTPTPSPTRSPSVAPTEERPKVTLSLRFPFLAKTPEPTAGPTSSPDSRAQPHPPVQAAMEETTLPEAIIKDEAIVSMTFTRGPTKMPSTRPQTQEPTLSPADSSMLTTNTSEPPIMNTTIINMTSQPTESQTLRPTLSPNRPPATVPAIEPQITTAAPTEGKEVITKPYLVVEQSWLQQAGIASQVILNISLWPPTGGDELIAESCLLASVQDFFCMDLNPVDGIFLNGSVDANGQIDNTATNDPVCVLRNEVLEEISPPPSMQQEILTPRSSGGNSSSTEKQPPVILSRPSIRSVIYNTLNAPANVLVSNKDPLAFTSWEISWDILQMGPSVVTSAMKNYPNQERGNLVQIYSASVEILQQSMEWELQSSVRDGTFDELLADHSAESGWNFYGSLVGEEMWTFEAPYNEALNNALAAYQRPPSTANPPSAVNDLWRSPAILILCGAAVAVLVVVVTLACRFGRRDKRARNFRRQRTHVKVDPTEASAAAAAGGSTRLEQSTMDHQVAVGGGQGRELDLEHRKTPFEVKIKRISRVVASAAHDTLGAGADDTTRIDAASAITSAAVSSMAASSFDGEWSVEEDAKIKAWSSQPV